MIPISFPSLGERERQYLIESFDSGWISSRGPFVERAEEKLALLTGVPHASVVNTGTAALHLALLAANVGPGDEVVIPATTYVATLNAVLYVGATPIIVDVDPHTWCISIEELASALSPATKAVIAVDVYGHPADYPSIRTSLAGTSITIVADAAESIGARIGSIPAVTLADMSCFSFFGNKIVTSGEGGAVLCRNETHMARIRQLRNQGNHPTRRYFHEIEGYNYRMPNTVAAILTAQIERIDELLADRNRVVADYRAALMHSDIVVPQGIADGVKPSPWLFSVRIPGIDSDRRGRIAQRLLDAGIETRPVFAPMSKMPYLPDRLRSSTPVSNELSRTGLSLPTYPSLTRDAVDFVVSTLIAEVDGALKR